MMPILSVAKRLFSGRPWRLSNLSMTVPMGCGNTLTSSMVMLSSWRVPWVLVVTMLCVPRNMPANSDLN